jgi:hypothetical protein
MLNRIAAAFTLTLACVAPAAAGDVDLPVEHAQVIRLPGEASTVVVGNPSIADALVHDGRTLVLTGRLQGRTNVIALDRIGRVIYSSEITVSNPVAGQVALFRGPQRFTLSCGDVCEDIPRVGDEPGRTDTITGQQRDRLGIAETAMSGDSGAGSPQ